MACGAPLQIPALVVCRSMVPLPSIVSDALTNDTNIFFMYNTMYNTSYIVSGSSRHSYVLGKKLELLKKFMGTHKDYSSILIYNKTGIKIAGHNGIVIGENVSHESFFKKAIQGNIYRGIAQSNYLKSSTEKEILLSGPLYDKSGKINGILVLSYPLDFKHASTGLQSNLRISLLSDDGKVIYSNYGNSSYGTLSNASAEGSLEYQPIYGLIKDSNIHCYLYCSR